MINTTAADVPKAITVYGGGWWECSCGNDPTFEGFGHAVLLDASSIPLLFLSAGMESSIAAVRVVWS